MALRFFALAALAVLSTAGVSSAVAPAQRIGLHAIVSPGAARLYAVGTRGVQPGSSAAVLKMDSVLADLSRHLSLVRPDYQLADLHSLSPAAKFTQRAPTSAPLVLVDAVTRGDPQSLKAALEGLGLEHASVYANDVGGWLPVTAIGTAAARAELVSLRAAMPHTRGAVALQGDYVQQSALVRTTDPSLTGAGVTVGVLSDSFNCYAVYAASGSTVPVSGNEGYAPNGFTADYATDVSTGALPSGVNVLAEPYTSVPSAAGNCLAYGAPTETPFGDEGRAMLQIVHAVAPGAALAFYTADDSEADFANGIQALAAAGAKVIADDVGYFDEPFFQDGLVAQAVDAVEAGGVAYFSAAGNDSNLTYQNTAPSFTTAGTGSMVNENLLNFDTTGATTTTSLPVTVPAIPPGDFLAIVVEWDQPYVTGATGASPGATSQIDLCVTGATGSTTITDYDGNAVSCTSPNAVGVDPVQILVIGNPANAAGNTATQSLNIMLGLAAGSSAPGRILVSVEDDGLGSTIDAFFTGGPTIQGHPGAAGAAAVGAAFYFNTPACGTTPAQLESYSSVGGAPILFSTAGTPLTTPTVRQKPDFVGPDGVNTTFLGFTLASDPSFPKTGLLSTTIAACQNNPSYPNFFGTSAAAPHAAGIAALALQANTALTPTQIYQALRSTALPMSSTTPNFNSGYGFIQANTALTSLGVSSAGVAPPAPTLTLGKTSIPAETTTTLTWSSSGATSCTASGNANANQSGWSGVQQPSATFTISPETMGTYVYSLTCANAAGNSPTSSVTLTVTAATDTGGGGGELDPASLLVLAGCVLLLRHRRGRRGWALPGWAPR